MQNNCVFIAFGGTWSNNSSVPSQFKALADELTRKGVLVVFLIQGKPDPELAEEKNIHYWPSRRPTRLKDAFFLIRLINSYKPNCLITQWAATNIMLIVGWLMKIPYRIVWYHTLSEAIKNDWVSSDLKLKILRFRKRFVYKCATHIIPVSNYALSDFENIFHIYNKSHVFYNGMKSVAEDCPGQVTSNKVTCIARFDYTKGQDILIKAFRLVVNKVPDARLILVGDGVLNSEYKSLVSNLELGGSVVFTGRVTPDEVLHQLRTSKVSVLPSRIDNCPLAIIESLNSAVPVIASSTGGIPEILIDGVSGYLINSEDIEELAEKIIKVLTDSLLRSELSINGRMDFLRRFEISKVIDDQTEWLEEIGVLSNRMVMNKLNFMKRKL